MSLMPHRYQLRRFSFVRKLRQMIPQRPKVRPIHRQLLRSWVLLPLLTLCTLLLICVPSSATSDRATLDRTTSDRTTSDRTTAPVVQDSLIAQGKTHYAAGRFTDAAAVWQQAAQTYQAQGDSLNQALSLSYWAIAQQELGNLSAAQQAIATSLDLLSSQTMSSQRSAQSTAILAQTLNTQGGLQFALGQTETALETWKTAEQTYAQLNDTSGIWGSQLNQAQALQTLGLFRRATGLLEQMNQQVQATPDSALKVSTLSSLGNLWQAIGNSDAAQTVLQQSLAIAQQLHLPAETSSAFFSLANATRSKPDIAIDYYQQAAKTALTPLARLQIQVNQFSLLIDQQRWTDAQTLATQIQPQLNTLSPSRTGIYSQVNYTASLIRTLNTEPPSSFIPSPSSLISLLTTAIEQSRTLQDSRAESYALGELGALYEQTQQWQEAQTVTQQALFIAQSINAPDIAYRWEWQLGRLYKQQGDRPAAIAAYSEAVGLLKSLRADLVSANPDIQFDFREKVEPVYRDLVDLLVQGDLNAGVTQSANAAHSVNLGNESTFDSKSSQSDLKQAREVIESLQLAELQNFFRAACLDADPSQIDQVDPTAAVFYPIVLPSRLVVILALPGQPLLAYSTTVSQTEIETIANHTLESLNPIFSDRDRLNYSQNPSVCA
jgi:tetratricopeptide (TPR) repeat protein